VVEGSKTYAVAFDEPTPFIDPPKMATTATQSESGWTLNGAKVLPNPKADFYLVFASAIGPTGPIGPICLLVDSGAPGTTLSDNLLTLTNCAVPADHVLGTPGKALGLGHKWFPLTRIIRAAAVLGTCDHLLEVSAQYAHDWTSMGTHISERKAIQQTLGDMAGDVEALRWLVYHTAWLAAEGKKIEYDSMLVKLQAHKVLTDTVNRSVRIHGGTIPPILEWLRKNAASSGADDSLRFAVARETISRLQP
jgi:alkylation response protein AidB-like acyl-CoA dehydrogenase